MIKCTIEQRSFDVGINQQTDLINPVIDYHDREEIICTIFLYWLIIHKFHQSNKSRGNFYPILDRAILSSRHIFFF